MTWFPTAALLAALAGAASGQTIDATEYVALGEFNAWRYVQDDDPTDTTFAEVGNVTLVNGVVRYLYRSPFIDGLDSVRMQLSVEDGDLLLHRLRFQSEEEFDDDVNLDAIEFDPPLVVGDTSTEVDVDEFVNVVDEIFTADVDLGPLDETIKVQVTGTITTSWRSPGAFPGNPVNDPAGADADMLNWHWEFDLVFEGVDEDFDATFFDTADLLLGQGIGIQVATDPNSSLHVLDAAILPGQTVGGDFPPDGTALATLGFDTPGLFHLDQASDATAGDDVVMLSDLFLEHNLSGQAFLRGMISAEAPAGGGEGSPAVPFQLKGKIRGNATTGTAKVTLAGKVKGLLEKPLALKIKAEIGADSTSLPVTYKSGPEIFGEFPLGIAPHAAESAAISLNRLVDTSFTVKSKRKLGAEGTLELDGTSFAISVRETRASKEGFPDKHVYALNQTGLKKKLLVARAQSTQAADYALDKFVARLFGFRFEPESLEEVDASAADSVE